MSQIIEEAYQTAIDAAIIASKHVLKYWPNPLNPEFDKERIMQIFEKSEGIGNYATIADIESENLIIEKIKQKFPTNNHAILAEESKYSTANSEYQWIIDPIDGTLNFRNGIPDFGVSIGVLHKQTAVIGVLAMPALGQYIAAKKGEGAKLFSFDGKELMDLKSIAYTQPLNKALIAYDTGYENRAEQLRALTEKIADHVGYPPAYSSSSTANFRIALGHIGAYLHLTPTKYDIEASAVIIEEVGGVVTDINGNPIDWTAEHVSYLGARTPEIHQELLKLLSK